MTDEALEPKQKRGWPKGAKRGPDGRPVTTASAPSEPLSASAPQLKRVTFNGGAGRFRLHSPELEAHFSKLGFHIAWLNDTADQVYRAEQGGYSKVARQELPGHLPIGDPDVGSGNTSLDSSVSRNVGSDRHGRPISALLMKIPTAWFAEDEKVRQRPVDETEQLLRRGRVVSGPRTGQPVGNVYGDVKISSD